MTREAPSPYIFRKAAALGVVGSAMSKRCWTNTKNGPMFPNVFFLLVGNPSVGKGPALKPAEIILKSLDFSDDPVKRYEGIRVGVQDTTAPGLLDELLDDESLKRFTLNGKPHEFRSIVLVAEELSTLLHSVDHRFMGYLVKLLNCEPISTRLRKDGERKEVNNPSLSILGGVQPKVLHQIFPPAAWSMGLTARALFIHSDEQVRVPVFSLDGPEEEKHEFSHPLLPSIIHDCKQIATLKGKFTYVSDAMERINTWWMFEADKTKPKHPLLAENYGGKRIFQLLRLSMIHSAARNNDMLVEVADVETSIATLMEFEKVMPRIFESMGDERSNADTIADIAHRIETAVLATGNPVPYHLLMSMISQKVPAFNVKNVFEQMEEQNLIKEVRLTKRLPGAGGRKAYVPAHLRWTKSESRAN